MITPRRSVALLVAAAIPTAVAGAPMVANASSAHAAAAATVTLRNIKFGPKAVTISRGSSVTWVWKDGSVPHNVTGKGFKSTTKKSGKFVHRFAGKGTFRYSCTIHPGMTGTITVR